MESTNLDQEESQEAPAQGLDAIEKTLNLPLTDDVLATLRAGEWVLLSGTLYILGERAGKELLEEWGEETEAQPFANEDATLFFAESGEAPLGKVMGSLEPGSMMEHAVLSCALLDAGVRCVLGAGPLHSETIGRLKKKRGLYLALLSGTGALLARSVHQAEIVACERLGHEAVRRIKVSRMPCMIALDAFGRYLFQGS